MARRGRKRQLELETEYWRLLASGIGTVAACDAVGMGRKTGYRWRAETGGLAPGSSGRDGPDRALSVAAGAAADCHLAPARPGGARGSPGSWGAARPRSAGSCAATPAGMIAATMTASWRTPGPGSPRGGPAAPASRRDEQLRRVDPVEVGVGVEPGADRRPFAPGVSGSAELAPVSRDDLPGALPRWERRAEPVVDPAATDRAAAA